MSLTLEELILDERCHTLWNSILDADEEATSAAYIWCGGSHWLYREQGSW